MSTTDNDIDCEDFVEVNQNNYQIIENKAVKIGYSDGVNDGRQSVFQQGFDQGYKDGLTTAFSLEKYRSFFENLNTNKTNNANLMREKDVFLTLELKELKSLQIEGNSLSVDSQDYVKQTLDNLMQKMPISKRLLNI